MNWKLIPKDPKNQPASGVYSDWKEQISKECFFQCVYCAIHEAQFGGIDHYHIDHFRPKSIKRFKKLENSITNLFYACPICNRFKSNDWPNEPDVNVVSYIDPSQIDYSTLFTLAGTFEINGNNIAPNYIVERLFLNRPQLIMERRESSRRKQVDELIKQISDLIGQIKVTDKDFAIEILTEVDSIKNNLLGLEQYRRTIRPYKLAEIRKK